MIKRRDLLKALGALPLGIACGLPAMAAQIQSRKYLVLIELKGGNDGLNTVIPFRDPLYKKLRPNLALNAEQIIPINDSIGLHPSLKTLNKLFVEGEVAIIQGVGYQKPNFSHFNSIDIWESASDQADDGWLYKLFESNPSLYGELSGVVFGGSSGLFKGADSRFLNIRSLDKFLKQSDSLVFNESNVGQENPLLKYLNSNKGLILKTSSLLKEKISKAKPVSTQFPDTSLGNELKDAAKLIASGMGLPVIKVSLKGFDTHVEQNGMHLELLTELDDALLAFYQELQVQGLWSDVLMMTYSEFGRRAKENGSQGTDHGTASSHFVIGSRCRGGVYGENPKLDHLQNDNLIAEIDFRQLYATLEKLWFNSTNSVVDRRLYPSLDFLKSA